MTGQSYAGASERGEYCCAEHFEPCGVTIGNGCRIGTRAIILPGMHIGEGAVVGAGSVVTRDVPPDTVVAGNPARLRRRLE